MTSPESRDYGLLERLADEFADRHRRGERPTVQEYVDRHPELAADLREILPAMVELEKAQAVTAVPPAPAGEARTLGDFRILREIGRGGMGVVYEAEQLSLGRRVALKVLTQKMLADSKQKRRFEREAKAAAKLHHTNIVPVFGFGETDDTPFYVMQFIQGLGLEQVIKELAAMAAAGQPLAACPPAATRDVSAASVAASLLTGEFVPVEGEGDDAAVARTVTAIGTPPDPAPPNDSSPSAASSVALPGQAGAQKLTYWQSVGRVGAQVADALDYAHKQGVVHRDIKPSNLLLDLTGTVWVADFGLAKADDQQDLTHTGDILGTLRYMPPEAFVGKADARGDVYALGLTLYEMIALRPAFDEQNRHKLIGLVTSGTPPALRSLRPDVPRDLETIVQKATDRDPVRRYPTAGEMAADLRRFVADEPIRARRQTATEAAVRWARRHPGTAALASVILLLMVAVTVGSAIAASYFDRLARRAEQNAAAEAAERKKAQEQEQEADRQRRAADEQRRASESQVARQYGEAGARLASDGDVSGALLWNVEALKRAEAAGADSELTNVIRTRIGQLLRQVPVPSHALFFDSPVSASVLDPTGRYLAVALADGKGHLCDLRTGARTALVADGPLSGFEFSADSTRVLAINLPQFNPGGGLPANAPRPFVQVWNTATGTPLSPPLPSNSPVQLGGFGFGFGGETMRVPAVYAPSKQYFCLDDTRLALCPDPESCRLYDVATGREAQTVFRRAGYKLGVQAVSPNGRQLLIFGRKSAPPGSPVRPGQPFGNNSLSEYWVVDVSDPSRPGVRAIDPSKSANSLGGNTWAGFTPDGGLKVQSGEECRLLDAAGAVRRVLPLSQTGPADSSWLSSLDSPDGRFLLVRGGFTGLGEDRKPEPATIVEWATGKEVGLPTGFTGIEFGPQGRYVLGQVGDRIAVFDTASGRQTAALPLGLSVDAARFSPDGQYVLMHGSNTAVEVFSATTGQRVMPLLTHEAPVTAARFTPDGSTVVTTAGSAVRVWPLARQETVIRPAAPGASESAAVFPFLTPDGERVVTVSAGANNDAEVRVWNAATGAPVPGTVPLSLKLSAEFGGIQPSGTFDPTGTYLRLTNGFGYEPAGPWVVDTRALKLMADLSPRAPRLPPSREFNPGEWFTRYSDFWSPTGPVLLSVKTHTSPGGGGFLASKAKPPDDTLRVFAVDGTPLTPELAFPGGVSATWAPDGKHVLTAEEADGRWRCVLWALEPHQPLRSVREFAGIPLPDRLPGPESGRTNRRVGSGVLFAFSADGSRVLAKAGRRAQVWNLASGEEVGSVDAAGGPGTATMPQLSPDGKTLFVARTALQHTSLRAVDLATGGDRFPPLVPPSGRLNGFDISPAGDLVLTFDADSVQLWRATDGQLRAVLPQRAVVVDARFNADGRRAVVRTLLAGDARANLDANRVGLSVSVWDVATGQPLLSGAGVRGIVRGGSVLFLGRMSGRDWSGWPESDVLATRVLRTTRGGVAVEGLSPDGRPAGELQTLAEVLSARRVSGGVGLVVRTSADTAGDWARTTDARGRWGAALNGPAWHESRVDELRGAAPEIRPWKWSVASLSQDAVTLGWHLDRALTGAPDRTDLRLLRAQLAATDGRWERVLNDTPAAPTTVESWNMRIFARVELGQWAEALREYRAHVAWQKKRPGREPNEASNQLVNTPALALLALKNERSEFDKVMTAARAAYAKLSEGAKGLDGKNEQYLWPALLVPGRPPEALVELLGKPFNEVKHPISVTAFPLKVAVAYRSGAPAAVVAQLEPLFVDGRDGCTAVECVFLAMAAKDVGKGELAERALARAKLRASGGERQPRRFGIFDDDTSPEVYWHARVANEILLAEAEKVVRGGKRP